MTDADKKMLDEIIRRVHNLDGERKNEILNILRSWQDGRPRAYKRLEAKTGVDVVVGDSLIKTTTRDLSAGGIYINTSGKFEADKDVRIVFSVPGYEKPFKLKGMIVRVEQNGMAVRFKNITPYFKQILDDAIWKIKTGIQTLLIKTKFNLKVLLGCLSVFASAFFFYMATVIVKKSQLAGLHIDPAVFVFFRFAFGFVCVLILLWVKNKKIVVRKKRYLIGRTLANCVAVYCFFKGVELTSVVQANILNMTYPLFVAIFSWIFLKEQRDIMAVFIVLLAFAGIWLILNPTRLNFQISSLWGLASGISASVAIIYLNLSRKVHDTETTLFFLFGLGSVIIFIVFFNKMGLPRYPELKYLFYCSLLSIAGQYLITLGFKYITAVEGGIISSTRILLAAVIGPLIGVDPFLTVSGWIGACLIFGANVYLTWKRSRRTAAKPF